MTRESNQFFTVNNKTKMDKPTMVKQQIVEPTLNDVLERLSNMTIKHRALVEESYEHLRRIGQSPFNPEAYQKLAKPVEGRESIVSTLDAMLEYMENTLELQQMNVEHLHKIIG